jgi:hypothetical protein
MGAIHRSLPKKARRVLNEKLSELLPGVGRIGDGD